MSLFLSDVRKKILDQNSCLTVARASEKVGSFLLYVEAQGYQTESRESKELTKLHIRHLREALEADKTNPKLIINVRNSGYSLLVD